ncbi:hypothetical protein GWI33_017660 [Rhynchophorus ferrugineus]|uniref:RRM domain-containing protein n=1 Tax=Rhynchophorus ferrugineus TaxID=354439 RepID=A0A834I1J8_RHYFE|nr:hypothetical protein GWI33_017660 [Rhynchophorus ferrugineus]
MGSYVYVGNIPCQIREKELESFFRGFGRIRSILVKTGYGFVEFDDNRDARDAVNGLQGKTLSGSRVSIEMTCGKLHRRATIKPFQKNSGRGPRQRRPIRTKYRIFVENLSTEVSWQDLKDFLRPVAKVTFADAHKRHKNSGVAEFASYEDMKKAIRILDNKDLKGKRIRLIEDKSSRGSQSVIRSPRGRNSTIDCRRRSRSQSETRFVKWSKSRSISTSSSVHRRSPSISRNSNEPTNKEKYGCTAKSRVQSKTKCGKRSKSRIISASSHERTLKDESQSAFVHRSSRSRYPNLNDSMENKRYRYINRSRSNSKVKSLESKRSRSRSGSSPSPKKTFMDECRSSPVHRDSPSISRNSVEPTNNEKNRFTNRSSVQSKTKCGRRSKSRSTSTSSSERRLTDESQSALVPKISRSRYPNSNDLMGNKRYRYINRSRSNSKVKSLESKRSRSRSGSSPSLKKKIMDDCSSSPVYRGSPSTSRNNIEFTNNEECRFTNRSNIQSKTKCGKRSKSRSTSTSSPERRLKDKSQSALDHKSSRSISPSSNDPMENKLYRYINRSKYNLKVNSLDSKRSRSRSGSCSSSEKRFKDERFSSIVLSCDDAPSRGHVQTPFCHTSLRPICY